MQPKKNTKKMRILSLMYHRFEENNYPSTNIKMSVFKNHMEIIKKNNFEFFDPKILRKNFIM